MKSLLLVIVCFAAVFAADSLDFGTKPEGTDTSGEDELYPYGNEDPFDNSDNGKSAAERQDSASGHEIQDPIEPDYEDYNDEDKETAGDMSELVGRRRRCRKALKGRCQNKNVPCKKGYKASKHGRPFCMSIRSICCYPVPKTTAAPTTTPPVTTPAPATTATTPTTTTTTTTTTTPVPATTTKVTKLSWLSVGSDKFVRFPQKLTWFAARALCQSKELDLYQPKDSSTVATYLDNNFSDRWYWVGARGNGVSQVWLSGTSVPKSAPWYSDYSKYVSTDKCMEIITHSGYGSRKQTLAPVSCTNTHPCVCG